MKIQSVFIFSICLICVLILTSLIIFRKKERKFFPILILGILGLSILITCIIFAKKELMPALQSVWFIPHIAAYIFAYTVLGCAFIIILFEWFYFVTAKCAKFFRKMRKDLKPMHNFTKINSLHLIKQMVTIGTASLGIGICLGALWAKKAWGQYWSWDIKETAALITWAIFLLYIHLQKIKKINRKILWVIVIIGFLSLQFTWYGVRFLPASKKSPHTFYEGKK